MIFLSFVSAAVVAAVCDLVDPGVRADEHGEGADGDEECEQ
jgi:hypothetical protein